VLWSGS